MSERTDAPSRSRTATAAAGVVTAASVAILLAAAPAAGQTPITGTGLGYPVAPVDARAAALGGAAATLPGGSLSARSPAALTAFGRVTLGFTLSPEHVSIDVSPDEPAQSTGRSRLSVARVVVPAGPWRFAAGFSPELDQDWRVTLEDSVAFSGRSFPYRETRRSDGGLSAANVALARRVGPLTLGVGVDRLTGSLERSVRRSFRTDTAVGGAPLDDILASGSWAYSGWRARGGVAVDVGDRARLDVSGGVAGDLEAVPDGPAETRTYDYPASVSASGSLRLSESLLVTGSGGWTGWSSVDEGLREGSAEDTRWAGAGLELSDVEVGPVTVPLRLGGRVRELPFVREGREQLTERAITGGFSVFGAGGLASLGVSLEVGSRGNVADAGIAEDFRRLHLTLQIRQ